jgi:hypothetical protein
MRRYLWLLVVPVVVGAVVLATRPADPVVSLDPAPVHYSDLPADVYKSGRVGYPVRVSYPFRLHPTSDPLAFDFRPGSPVIHPTHRIHFAAPPRFPDRLPVVVVGTVERFAPDLLIRPNNVPGVVVISAAAVVPATSP